MPGTEIRPFAAQDREAFLAMWRAFIATAPNEPGNPRIGEVNFERVMSGGPLRGIVACRDGQPLGFALFLAFPFTWARGDVCYLQDIFVAGEARGQGLARAMIAHLVALGEANGWFKIFWMIPPENATAQRLYDKVAKRMDYIRYDLNVCEP
jgi:ribosomal protein S18 acetylase RimI-like enzyme